ncbi:AER288Cp [Eremothecium gossypii ATCC 10895]|uniref:AER288Cp n=1 Tax=Eremothecium gossypii (strain ATCC 10895 / CBS 109.51 / FGSC 9923 / NRRL Y-1056) TaxID=284811 RepID=Q756W7_EREGS|nr:AER288Cp [Eremothecium gossypii ATCC 10895]AAS52969.1 AER288Cp [Eremothecium gossypii ATCC 10895]AEY97277.1 FAER288Cp [Eremothecium gossypii FDAG1]
MDVNGKTIANEALELLESLEQQHRHDLTLHLYSAHLLKQLLRKAHKKKRALEAEVYIKTMIKDNWTSWPSPNTVIDPHTDCVYEDEELWGSREEAPQMPERGEISERALKHAMRMMRVELDSVWQRQLTQSAALVHQLGQGNVSLDVNKMAMPLELVNHIFARLDAFAQGLNVNFAKQVKVELATQPSMPQLSLKTGTSDQRGSSSGASSTNSRRKAHLDYRDLIVRGCEMKLDMSNVYIKCLFLFEGLVSRYNVKDFKIPKEVLKKYVPQRQAEVVPRPVKNLQKEFWELEALTRDRNLTFDVRQALRQMCLRNGFSRDKKTFMMVQEINTQRQKALGVDRRPHKRHKGTTQDSALTDGGEEADDELYGLADCLIK